MKTMSDAKLYVLRGIEKIAWGLYQAMFISWQEGTAENRERFQLVRLTLWGRTFWQWADALLVEEQEKGN